MEIAFFEIIFLIIGLCIGSFSGTLLDEEMQRSFWTGRSQCASCNKTLRWYELVPVFSYFFQKGHCRDCHKPIPVWLLHIEITSGILWLGMGVFFLQHGMSFESTLFHLLILSMILIIAIEDWRDYTISDRLTVPMIVITLILVRIAEELQMSPYLPSISEALIGAFIGMLFYMLQMIIPAMGTLIRKEEYSKAIHVLFTPLFFPFWLIVKTLFGEKKADKLISSIAVLDCEPTWVGGGDIRLGILVGLITGPLYFFWVIGIGYSVGTLVWLVNMLLGRKKIEILPVAPLLFVGLCGLWMMLG